MLKRHTNGNGLHMNKMVSRSAVMLGSPQILSEAFADSAQVAALIDGGAPYKTITAVQKNPPNDDTPGWFRNFWALGGKVIFDGAEELFHNPLFIEAAKTSFRAEVVQPLAMMSNLNVPAAASPPHLDLPYFRGAHSREIPAWMLAPMGYSGLFQAWAIPVASAISWFYRGSGGDFEYWPEGLDGRSKKLSPPYYNKAIVADNEYMYHRVAAMGATEDYLARGIGSDALLHREVDGWHIKQGRNSIVRYRDDQVRVSILWKAYCFKSQYVADAFADPANNLAPEKIVALFSRDLAARGIVVHEPSDLASDSLWRQAICRHYAAPQGAAY